MKTFLKLLILLGSLKNQSATCQKVISINIDKVISDGEIKFLNLSNNESLFECELLLLLQKEFEYEFAMECEELYEYNIEKLTAPENQILKFNSQEEITNWINNKTFKWEKHSEDGEVFWKSYFQILPNNLAIEEYYNKTHIDSNYIKQTSNEVYEIAHLKINDEFYIPILVNIEDDDIFPIAINHKNQSRTSNTEICNYHIDPQTDITNKLKRNTKIKKSKDGFYLSYRTINSNLLNEFHDTLFKNAFHIVGQNTESFKFYDYEFNEVEVPDVKAAKDCFQSIQLISSNQIKWLSQNSQIVDTFPKPQRSVCPSGPYRRRSILKTKNEFHEIRTDGYNLGGIEKKDTILLIKSDSIKSIKYLTNKIKDTIGTLDDLNALTELDLDLYKFESTNQTGIIKFRDIREEKIRNINYQNYTTKNQDSIINIINNLNPEIEQIIIYQTHKNGLDVFGYYHPIRYSKNNLYGYLNIHKEPIFKQLDKYNFNYAKIKTKEDKEGWIDLTGKIYLNE